MSGIPSAGPPPMPGDIESALPVYDGSTATQKAALEEVAKR